MRKTRCGCILIVIAKQETAINYHYARDMCGRWQTVLIVIPKWDTVIIMSDVVWSLVDHFNCNTKWDTVIIMPEMWCGHWQTTLIVIPKWNTITTVPDMVDVTVTKGGETVHKYSIETVHKYSIDNKLTCTSSMCSMFALLDCFLKRYIQQNKECKHHIKGKNEFFFARSSKFSNVQMGHLHCI